MVMEAAAAQVLLAQRELVLLAVTAARGLHLALPDQV